MLREDFSEYFFSPGSKKVRAQVVEHWLKTFVSKVLKSFSVKVKIFFFYYQL